MPITAPLVTQARSSLAKPAPSVLPYRRSVASDLMQYALYGVTLVTIAMTLFLAINPHSFVIAGLAFNRVSTVFALLVSFVGAAAYKFSMRYLYAEKAQPVFLRWLFATVYAAYVLMLACDLRLIFSCWLIVSIGLHQLLTYYSQRKQAFAPARKKFLISRFGDLALLTAFGLIAYHWETWDIAVFLNHLPAVSDRWAAAVALLIVVAALTKSAQFPFHSWLPETMEAPTPVSALMHAGIINAGGALLLRFAPLLSIVPIALEVLVLVGVLTTSLGLITLWAQSNIKRKLAWSTVSQMGFMMVECGMGAFAAAVLHIVGHGFYKAWSFLSSATVSHLPKKNSLSPRVTLLVLLCGIAASAPALVICAGLAHMRLRDSPADVGLTLILAASFGQLWVGLYGSMTPGRRLGIRFAATALSITGPLCFAAVWIYRAAELYFSPVLGMKEHSGTSFWVAAVLPGVSLAFLSMLHAVLPWVMRTRAGRAFLVHSLQGFYCGVIIDRVVESLWKKFSRQERSAS